jgi:hypothetical protein
VTRPGLLLLLAPLAAHAQLTLLTPDGSAAGAVYDIGQAAVGSTKDVRLRAENPSPAPLSVTSIGIAGAGFSIVNTSSPPFAIAPGNFQDITVRFSPSIAASFSANFQIRYAAGDANQSISVLLMATAVPPVTLTVSSPCIGPDPSTGAIQFGSIHIGQTQPCTFTLQNPANQTATVSGAGFTVQNGSSSAFTITFTPTAAQIYSGTLTLGPQTFPLSGVGLNPPLPAVSLTFDPGAPASGQQRALMMQLASPSPIDAAGQVTMTFESNAPSGADDPAVVFVATGTRSIPFSIHPGDTQVSLGPQGAAVFQTGTTEGIIRFSITANAPLTGTAAATMTIPPAPIEVDNATGTARAGALDVQVWGFDNTYTAGKMSFQFYDAAGNVIAPGPVPADFTPQFQTYFSTTTGSAFQMRVTFPVTGDSTQVSAVDVQLNNSAGSVTIQHLVFQ